MRALWLFPLLIAFFSLGALALSEPAREPAPVHHADPDPNSMANQKDGETKDEDLPAVAKEFLESWCFSCHGGGGKIAGLDVKDLQDMLRSKNSKGNLFLVPGKPDQSAIWQMVFPEEKNNPKSARMPPGKTKPSAEELKDFKRWIEVSAKFPLPRPKKREFIGDQDILKQILKDLVNVVPPSERAFTRYFSLAHLWNNQAVSERDLDYYRAALSKLLNSLTYRKEIVQIRPIDNDFKTIYAVDLRDLINYAGKDWDQAGYWDQLLEIYPYGLKFTSQAAQLVHKLSGNCWTPFVRADWFVFAAARPSPYHVLLALPTDARVLEKNLGIDITHNFKRNRLWRAGLLAGKSGVSKQNRLVERHETPFGAYWKSYDFKDVSEREDLTFAPLGPQFLETLVAKNAAFKHAGGEVIFNLPNGHQAYLLVDGLDNRIDKAPIEVVRDNFDRFSGTSEIVNGISCIGCHRNGMLPFVDQIRPLFAKEQSTTAEKVKEIYSEKAVMDSLVLMDQLRFLRAINESESPLMRTLKEKNKQIIAEFYKQPITELNREEITKLERKMVEQVGQFHEPIAILSLAYDQPVDVKQATFELGLEKVEDIVALAGQKQFTKLQLGALAKPGGTVPREVWENAFHDVAEQLSVGLPVRVQKSALFIVGRKGK